MISVKCKMMKYDVEKVRSCEKKVDDCHKTVSEKLKRGEKCFGPGVHKPDDYKGDSPYPPVQLPVNGCTINEEAVNKVIPSYGKGYGDGGYIDVTSVEASAIALNVSLLALILAIVVV